VFLVIMFAKVRGFTSRANAISRLLFLNCRQNSRRPIYRSSFRMRHVTGTRWPCS